MLGILAMRLLNYRRALHDFLVYNGIPGSASFIRVDERIDFFGFGVEKPPFSRSPSDLTCAQFATDWNLVHESALDRLIEHALQFVKITASKDYASGVHVAEDGHV